jgi:hypothetical protein
MDVEPLRFEPGYCWCVVGEYLVEVRHLAEISSCELRVEVMDIPQEWVADFCRLAMANESDVGQFKGIAWSIQSESEVVASVLVPLNYLQADRALEDLLFDMCTLLQDECLELCARVRVQKSIQQNLADSDRALGLATGQTEGQRTPSPASASYEVMLLRV